MSKKTAGALASRFGGVAIGATILATPAYIIHSNFQPVFDNDCIADRTGLRHMAGEPCLDAAAFKTTTNLGGYFFGLAGGLYGWRRGRKFHESFTADSSAVTAPEPKAE